MGNKVKIIAQSSVLNLAEIVEEKDANARLLEIQKEHSQILLHNRALGQVHSDDDSLLVTTSLIKE